MQVTRCSIRVNPREKNLCFCFNQPLTWFSTSDFFFATRDAKHFITEEVIQLCILDLKRKPHIQTSFLNEKDPSSAKIFIFLQYAYIFVSGERCQRIKKGENQSTLIHPVQEQKPPPTTFARALCLLPGVSLQVAKVFFSSHQPLAPQQRMLMEQLCALLVLCAFRTGLHTSTHFTRTCESICYNRSFQPL